jgi:hypothetical protein
VRLADALFRGGHLSEQALVEVCMTGERPAHVDRCELCADRAVELGRWLDDVRLTGIAAADAAFPPERLAAQQSQILRRLEQLDQPSRIIAFPRHYRLDERQQTGRRIAPVWVGVGVAAGLVVGVIGGQMSARLGRVNPVSIDAAVTAPSPAAAESAKEIAAISKHDAEDSDGVRVFGLDPGVVLASYREPQTSGGR